jgi:hypothetical protein
MNKKFFIAWGAIFIVWMAGSFVVHGLLLHHDYAKLAGLFRPDAQAQQFFPLMLLAHVSLAAAFVWIYARGAEAKPWLLQGIRFGVAVALLTVVPTYLIYYVVQPMPAVLVIKQILLNSILIVILALIAAYLHRPPAAPT